MALAEVQSDAMRVSLLAVSLKPVHNSSALSLVLSRQNMGWDLTSRAKDLVGMSADLSVVDQRVKTSLGCGAAALHAPEGRCLATHKGDEGKELLGVHGVFALDASVICWLMVSIATAV